MENKPNRLIDEQSLKHITVSNTNHLTQNPFHVTSLKEEPELLRFSKFFDGIVPTNKNE